VYFKPQVEQFGKPMIEPVKSPWALGFVSHSSEKRGYDSPGKASDDDFKMEGDTLL
jgi:hypothetical protein